MNDSTSSLLPTDEINSVLTANHDDIFCVLGMHPHPSGNGLIVRAFLPGAQQVDVIANNDKKTVASLTMIDPVGLFEGKMGRRRKPFSYHLRISYLDNSVDNADNLTDQSRQALLVKNPTTLAPIDKEDPYRFGSLLDPNDVYLFCQGTQERAYQWLGAHMREVDGVRGVNFVVWAPDAARVSVVGDFNLWDGRLHVMRKHVAAGLWEIFIPHIAAGSCYKFEIVAKNGNLLPLKSDPFGFAAQLPPLTASLVTDVSDYQWQDHAWQTAQTALTQSGQGVYQQPVSIYEVHAGSWRRCPEDDDRPLSYRELAAQLIPYALDLGFTHIQLMPISEHPFDGSWGYQPIGLYAPTSRFGCADDFKYFVDCCHQAGLGVLLDWVPGHFPTDAHGIGNFDGTALYEHQDLRQGFHPDWQTLIYNYGRKEVLSYLLSNAIFWLDQFHIDGLRVDAVASMLYLDYSREEGQWVANAHGGRENLEAIELLRQINSRVHFNYPNTLMIAEESTAWPSVTKPIEHQGLGFGFKWNMGWMNDSLSYMQHDPIHRQHHHNEMTFSLIYSFSENFVLPLSHDEVVHGKGSLLNKMPGDDWQKFANLRAYFGFMWTHPGKKLLFMGGEFGQWDEWNHNKSLDWHLLQYPTHQGLQTLIRDLNHCYRQLPALHQQDCQGSGFQWLVSDNAAQSIFVYLRHGLASTASVLVVVNMTPNTYPQYQMGVPTAGHYQLCLNSDHPNYGGSGQGVVAGYQTIPQPCHGHQQHLDLCIPPLSCQIFAIQPQGHNDADNGVNNSSITNKTQA